MGAAGSGSSVERIDLSGVAAEIEGQSGRHMFINKGVHASSGCLK